MTPTYAIRVSGRRKGDRDLYVRGISMRDGVLVVERIEDAWHLSQEWATHYAHRTGGIVCPVPKEGA